MGLPQKVRPHIARLKELLSDTEEIGTMNFGELKRVAPRVSPLARALLTSCKQQRDHQSGHIDRREHSIARGSGRERCKNLSAAPSALAAKDVSPIVQNCTESALCAACRMLTCK